MKIPAWRNASPEDQLAVVASPNAAGKSGGRRQVNVAKVKKS